MTMRSPIPGIQSAADREAALPARSGPGRPAPARWQAADPRLYPLIMSDPDLYEAAVTLMAEARDVLRARCDTVSALADVDATGVLDRCPSAPATTARGVDSDTVVDAARAYRWRELAAFQPADAPLGSNREGHR
jgi:hypothetical protein